MLRVNAFHGRFKRRLIGQRTCEALAVKKLSGVRFGRPGAVPKQVVRRIERQRARGDLLRAIAERLNRDGDRPRKAMPSGTRQPFAASSCALPESLAERGISYESMHSRPTLFAPHAVWCRWVRSASAADISQVRDGCERP